MFFSLKYEIFKRIRRKYLPSNYFWGRVQTSKMSRKLPTAVRWCWFNDKTWQDYDKKVNEQLEADFQKKKKKIPCSKEHHVDLDFATDADIKKNFNNMELEKNLVGIQRRNDEPMKRRAVKREVPNIFKKEVFYIPRGFNDYILAAKVYGAEVENSINKTVTIFLCPESDVKNQTKEINKAQNYSIPIVGDDFLVDCITAGRRMDPKTYPLKIGKSDDKKRKGSGEGSDSKKAKWDEGEEAPKVASDDEGPPSELFLQDGCKWTGKCIYKKEGTEYPFVMKILESKDKKDKKKISGHIKWPTLKKSVTKFKGSFKNGKIEFEEYEIVKGKDEVEVPMKYKGKVTGKKISGEIDDKKLTATFKLDFFGRDDEDEKKKDKKDKTKDKKDKLPDLLELLKPQAKFNGVCFTVNTFAYSVFERENNSLQGTLAWENPKRKTKFKGSLNSSAATFDLEETMIKKDDDEPEKRVYHADGVREGDKEIVIYGTFLTQAKKKEDCLDGIFEISV
eukprot:TRINITY_DN3278_c0_g1_i1.p1 TRINITY_DN3278_c0_g1~~TRINITY_DN3278_c0_g1_i1.p1  ORF type:complete len:506 (-),score=138.01 TRINITY_DN3278_c0_g1_i1:116-1633(-)